MAEFIEYFSGTVKEKGQPVQRILRLYNRDTGELIDETQSDPDTGEFQFDFLVTESTARDEYYIIALDNTGDISYDALIFDGLNPSG